MLVSTLLALGLMVTAVATPKMQPLFNKTYPSPKDSPLAKAKCMACHVNFASQQTAFALVERSEKRVSAPGVTVHLMCRDFQRQTRA
jgi:hypothetical protein